MRSTNCLNCVSIHLMLLFIADRIKEELEQEQFQYISCYSLSGRKARITIWQGCFNTSHVTLYRCLNGEKFDFEKRFNTSHVTLYLVQLGNGNFGERFQYISCYSLSRAGSALSGGKESFNTSHITLYLKLATLFIDLTEEFQYISCYSLSSQGGINTQVPSVFQYISCYSLSKLLPSRQVTYPVSIHLMLLFIICC